MGPQQVPAPALRACPLQVHDSERDEAGRPPRHCLVSAATRRELSAWGLQRIGQKKAKVRA